MRVEGRLFFLGSFFLSGCLNTPSDGALTTVDIDRMASGRMHAASIENVNTHSVLSLEDDPSGIAGQILRTLAPVNQHKCAAKAGVQDFEYVFVFQSGSDPIVFKIRICDGSLCYQVGELIYEGGDSSGFLRLVLPLFQEN